MKIVSLNVEGQKHLTRVREFLAQEKPDVVCLMEVFEDRVGELLVEQYSHSVFAPNFIVDQTEKLIQGERKWGILVLSKTPMTEIKIDYYGDCEEDNLPRYGQDTHTQVLIRATVESAGKQFRLATTHFTWSKMGEPDKRQRRHLGALLDILGEEKEVMLMGDFNIPRGSKLYQVLAAQYVDNIPLEIVTTLDPSLHYANQEVKGRLKLVVDYLWSTSEYTVKNVRVISGVSDHCAIVGEVLIS